MDISNIAKVAENTTEILVIYFVADSNLYLVAKEVEELYEAVLKKFAKDMDKQANECLRLLKTNPNDERQEKAFIDLLIKKAKDDKDFAEQLTQLVYNFDQALCERNLMISSRKEAVEDDTKNYASMIYIPTTRAKPPEEITVEEEVIEEEEEIEEALTRGGVLPVGGLPEGPAAHEASKKLLRYPNITGPDKAILNERFSLLVQLLMKSPKPDSEGIIIEDKGLPEVEIVVYAKGFDIEGCNTKVLKIDRNNDSDERFVFIPRELGDQQIRVDFYQNGRRIGTERRNILVTEKPVIQDIKQPETSWTLQLNAGSKGCPPDLEICVQLDNNDNRTLNFILHTTKHWIVNPQTGQEIGYHYARFGQVSLKESPEEKIKAVYEQMSLMARKPEVDNEERMAAIGNDLWDELIPQELKIEYWQFKEHIRSILITSDEPWIPWEMIKPYRYNDEKGVREDELFWCQKFELSRWLSGPAPEDELPTGIARSVAPSQVNLAAVQEEVRFIEELSTLNPAITGLAPFSDKVQVLDFVENSVFTLLHFATHGGFDATLPNDSAILLSGGFLRPSDIHVRFGIQRPRPLIFINACEGAQMGFSFTGLGGWADRLVNKAEVGAFAGAMWEVQDALALEFAKNFYTSLLHENQTIAKAFCIAREAVRKTNPANSTWLAYVLYADPEARVSGAVIPSSTGAILHM